MSDFLQVTQSLAVALKALQMYTAHHPRAQESLATTHTKLTGLLGNKDRITFVVSGLKAFVDGQVQDAKSPHITLLVKLISERGISGFVFERGVEAEEVLAFLEGLATKPPKLEEQGGFEALLSAAGVRHIRVSQTRYQEVREGEESASDEDKAPAFSPAPPHTPAPPPPQSLEERIRAMREALLASLTRHATSIKAATGGRMENEDLGFLKGFGPADLSGLGVLAEEIGLGSGMPTAVQLGTLRQVLTGLTPQVQMSLLAGMGSLPTHPAGLGLGLKALAGELLAMATASALAKGATWLELRGPLLDILRPQADRTALVRILSARLLAAGLDASQAEALLRQLDWEALSLEAKLLKVLEEGHLFELSLEQRLAFLRELLDLRRFDEFLRIQDTLLEALRSDRSDLRLKAAQTLAGMARWAEAPGLPPGGEGALAEALRAHFAWEPDPPNHRWTAEALETLLVALIHRGELGPVISDYQELEGLCAFLEEQNPWRNEALARLRSALLRPQLLDATIAHAFTLERERMIQEVFPYLEFLGDPMVRHLLSRLGEEGDRTRRGRLVEAIRSLGPTSLPALMESLMAPTWYLVRNALTLLPDLGDAGCLPAILPLLRHPEPRVRRTAVRALWKLGGPAAEPHLLAQMKDTDGDTMREILFALGQLRSEGSLPQVAELAQDKRVLEQLRIQALDTLGHIASPKALPVLLECLRRKGFFGGGEPAAIRLAAARALVALGTPEAIAALQRVADGEPKGEEREAIRRLLQPPPPVQP
jgi:HEAT repeat protein